MSTELTGVDACSGVRFARPANIARMRRRWTNLRFRRFWNRGRSPFRSDIVHETNKTVEVGLFRSAHVCPDGSGTLEASGGDTDRTRMRHTLYENPVTHQFALVKLPKRFVEGDRLQVPPCARWFATRDEALASLADLLEQDEECDGP